MKKTILFIFFMIIISPSLFGQQRNIRPITITTSAGKNIELYKASYALLIGVSQYTAGWPKLQSVPDELAAVEEALQNNGFVVTKIIDPDDEQLESTFKNFIKQFGYDEANRLLFFYSGHGYSMDNGSRGYLVPTNAPDPRKDSKGFLRRALSMSQILTWCRDIRAKHALFLFDSCFSGTIFKAKALPAFPPHITDLISRPVRQFITAGDAGEEVPARSVFAPSFIKALRGEADLTNDGYVTGTELGMYLHDKVIYYESGQTPQYGKIKDPDLDEGDFVFIIKGSLDISSVPLKANIYLDNIFMGTTNCTLPNLYIGEHRLTLKKQGYLDYEQVVLLENGKTKRLKVNLDKIRPASLKIITEQPDCDVYLDGQLKGRTPITFSDLMPGTHEVKITHPFYNEWQQPVLLKIGEKKEITPPLIKKRGTLVIETTPVDAEVEIDGMIKGQTPLTLKDVEYGAHKLIISKTDYQTKQEKIELISDKANYVQIDLVGAKGNLSISGNVEGVDVYINNNRAGSLPLNDYQLNVGKYKIEVKAMGYEPFKTTVIISPDKTQNLPVKLQLKTTKKALIRSIIAPGLGQNYYEKNVKAILFPVLEIAAVAGAIGYNISYSKSINDYNSAKALYDAATVQEDIDNHFNLMQKNYDDIESAEQIRNIFIASAAGIWLWNVVDAALFQRTAEKAKRITQHRSNKLQFRSWELNGRTMVGVSFPIND